MGPWAKEQIRRRRISGHRDHTPEFDYEKKRSQVEAAVTRYELDHSILMDNDYAYWRALGNQYLPSFYLVDKEGAIAARVIGEVHDGDHNAKWMEMMIERLFADS